MLWLVLEYKLESHLQFYITPLGLGADMQQHLSFIISLHFGDLLEGNTIHILKTCSLSPKIRIEKAGTSPPVKPPTCNSKPDLASSQLAAFKLTGSFSIAGVCL